MWEVLKNPEFRPGPDAQAKAVLTEIAGLEQTIWCKTGSLFIDHLQQNVFAPMAFDGTEYLRSMMTSTDRKAFSNYLVQFMKARG